jgi:hypothetical protein
MEVLQNDDDHSPIFDFPIEHELSQERG